ncbi:MAG TPA: hypothetical protein VFO16_22920, partial [Pseudonocardiaceae bacterium]|nr:hypothetical protein [Pseudonocardiaceae bacterium]
GDRDPQIPQAAPELIVHSVHRFHSIRVVLLTLIALFAGDAVLVHQMGGISLIESTSWTLIDP